MRIIYAVIVAGLLSLGLVAQEYPPCPKPQPPAPVDIPVDAKGILRDLASVVDKLVRLPETLCKAAYYAGVRDGAIGACCVLVVLYLLTQRTKQQ